MLVEVGLEPMRIVVLSFGHSDFDEHKLLLNQRGHIARAWAIAAH